jgi:hypothetical protein
MRQTPFLTPKSFSTLLTATASLDLDPVGAGTGFSFFVFPYLALSKDRFPNMTG